MPGKIVRGYWDCKFCGSKDIDGLVDYCPSCNAKKSQDVKYHLKEGSVSYVTDDELKKANISKEECDGNHRDWICNYCNTLNNWSYENCESCGSPRGEATSEYGEKEIASIPLFGIGSWKCEFCGNQNPKERSVCSKCGGVRVVKYESKKEKIPLNSDHDGDTLNIVSPEEFPKKKKKFFSKFSPKKIAIFSVIAASVSILTYGLFPYQVTNTVTDMEWSRNITIEEERTVSEEGMSVPSGGRVYNEETVLTGYKDVIDHYETVTEKKSREVLDGYEQVPVTKTREVISGYNTTYTDNGNGTFTEHSTPIYTTEIYVEYESKPIYKTEYYTEEHQEPVYRKEPVYGTKYYYYIERWFDTESYPTSAHDKNPYWYSQYTLEENERDKKRSESYKITFDNEKSDHVSLNEYLNTNIGDERNVTTCHFGLIYGSKEKEGGTNNEN